MSEAPGHLIEEPIGRCRQRRHERGIAEAARGDVARVIAAAVPAAAVVDGLVRTDQPFGDDGRSGHHLERRSGRGRGVDRVVEERVARIEQIVRDRLVVTGREVVRIERWIRRERHHAAGPRIEHHHSARDLAAERMAEGLEMFGQGRVHDVLQARIDRGDKRVARHGRLGGELRVGDHLPGRIDHDLLAARRAAQILIVLRLQAVLADHVVWQIALALERFVLIFVDLSDVAEQMRSAGLQRIVADRLRFEIDARQIVEQLRETRDRRHGQIAGENDGTVRFVGRHLVEALVVDAAMVEQPIPERGARNADGRGQRREFRLRIFDLRRDQTDHERRTVAHQHVPAVVVDDAARRGDRDQADLVGLRFGAIFRAMDQLHLYQPHDQDDEQQRAAGDEDADAPRRVPWREGRTPDDHRVM